MEKAIMCEIVISHKCPYCESWDVSEKDRYGNRVCLSCGYAYYDGED